MDFKIRKGLETPLKIHGMLANYFYIHSFVGGVLALMVFVSASSLVSGTTSALAFILIAMSSAGVYFGLKFYFSNKSNVNKLRFDKSKRNISNRDLIKSIK